MFYVYLLERTTGFQNELDVRNNKNESIKDCSHVSNINKG